MKLLYPAEIIEIYSADKRVISMCQASTSITISYCNQEYYSTNSPINSASFLIHMGIAVKEGITLVMRAKE